MRVDTGHDLPGGHPGGAMTPMKNLYSNDGAPAFSTDIYAPPAAGRASSCEGTVRLPAPGRWIYEGSGCRAWVRELGGRGQALDTSLHCAHRQGDAPASTPTQAAYSR